MKTFKNLMFVCATGLLFFCQIGYAQTYNDEDTTAEQVTKNEDISRSVLAGLGIDNNANSRSQSVEGNSIFLRQIGDFNTVSVNSATTASDINITQNGDSNDVSLDYVANTALTDVVQNGNNNRISDFVNNPEADITLDLIQDGDGLIFERDGANNLTKSLKFKQTDASKTLIIRSYF